MTKEQKQLLLVDLCARLPYGVKCLSECGEIIVLDGVNVNLPIEHLKPYLRQMNSMTEDELKELVNLKLARIERHRQDFVIKETEYNYTLGCWYVQIAYKDNSGEECVTNLYVGRGSSIEEIDFLNVNHFDYRGLIPKGLALEAKEGMYNTKQ